MYCPNCGKEIADGVKFCPECGKSMDLAEVATKKTSKNEHYLLALGFCIVLGVFLIGGVVIYNRQKTIEEQEERFKEAEKATERLTKETERYYKVTPSLGTIDLNYELPEPGSSQSE